MKRLCRRRQRPTDPPRALVPSFVAQPFLERPKMNFGIAPAELFNVRLETGMIEPAEHLVKLLPKGEADNRKRQSPKPHLFAEHAAKTSAASRLVSSLPAISSACP